MTLKCVIKKGLRAAAEGTLVDSSAEMNFCFSAAGGERAGECFPDAVQYRGANSTDAAGI